MTRRGFLAPAWAAFVLLSTRAVIPAASAAPAPGAGPPGQAAVDAAEYVRPQALVAVEGTRRLNLFCLGHGSPAVLLDAGSGGSTLDWRDVQRPIARLTRTCSYDRAGYGFSDPATRPSDARNAVDDVHRLIAAAGLGSAIVMVGHSNGGMYATLHAETYPRDVGGLVLVDPGFPGQQDYGSYGLGGGRAAELGAWTAGLVAKVARCVADAQAATLGLGGPQDARCLDDPPNRDPAIHRVLDRQYASVAYQQANLSEFRSSFATTNGITVDDREMPAPLRTLGGMPLVVLTASRHAAPVADFTGEDQAAFYAVWKLAHDRLAALSSAGVNIVVPDSGHFIQDDQPGAVVQAVTRVVGRLRGSRAVPGRPPGRRP